MNKNKAFAVLLASLLGGTGAHRFYLNGIKDVWGWAHFASIPVSALVVWFSPENPVLFCAALLVISVLAGFLEALVIGLTPDDKWDERYHQGGTYRTSSGWPLALVLIMTVAVGATTVLSVIARALDLWLTGGGQG